MRQRAGSENSELRQEAGLQGLQGGSGHCSHPNSPLTLEQPAPEIGGDLTTCGQWSHHALWSSGLRAAGKLA